MHVYMCVFVYSVLVYCCVCTCTYMQYKYILLLGMHACERVQFSNILLAAASRLLHTNGPKWYTNDDGYVCTYIANHC